MMNPTRVDWNAKPITIREGFLAMITFLEHYYEMTNADEIGALLGGLSTLPDGDPRDPAFKEEWLRAVELAKRPSP
jgi:hypothetical protein